MGPKDSNVPPEEVYLTFLQPPGPSFGDPSFGDPSFGDPSFGDPSFGDG